MSFILEDFSDLTQEIQLFISLALKSPPNVPYPDERRSRLDRIIPNMRSLVSRSLVGSTAHLLLAFVFFFLSIRGRKSPLGIGINLPYMINAGTGMYSGLRLHGTLLVTYILLDLTLNALFLSIVLWDFSKHGDTTPLAFFLPGVAADLCLVTMSLPLARALRKYQQWDNPEDTALTQTEEIPPTQTRPFPSQTTPNHSEQMPEPQPPHLLAPAAPSPVSLGSAVSPFLAPSAPDIAPASNATQGAVSGNLDTHALGSDLVCPITQLEFVDPVIAADGHTYERSAIEEWLKRQSKSPMTGEKLANKNLIPNHRLRSIVEASRGGG